MNDSPNAQFLPISHKIIHLQPEPFQIASCLEEKSEFRFNKS